MQIISIFEHNICIRRTNFWPTFNCKGEISILTRYCEIKSIKSSVVSKNAKDIVFINIHI